MDYAWYRSRHSICGTGTVTAEADNDEMKLIKLVGIDDIYAFMYSNFNAKSYLVILVLTTNYSSLSLRLGDDISDDRK